MWYAKVTNFHPSKHGTKWLGLSLPRDLRRLVLAISPYDRLAIQAAHAQSPAQVTFPDPDEWEDNEAARYTRHYSSEGRFELLRWALSLGAPWDEWACASAALDGDLETLQLIRSYGAPWNEDTCLFAAENGHLNVLQWAHANGAPWDSGVSYYAANNGDLEILQWIYANGLPWSINTCSIATIHGHLHILQWIRDDALDKWDEDRVRRVAARRGQVEILEWLGDN